MMLLKLLVGRLAFPNDCARLAIQRNGQQFLFTKSSQVNLIIEDNWRGLPGRHWDLPDRVLAQIDPIGHWRAFVRHRPSMNAAKLRPVRSASAKNDMQANQRGNLSNIEEATEEHRNTLGRWAEGVNRIAPRFRSLKTVDCGKQLIARNKPQTRYP